MQTHIKDLTLPERFSKKLNKDVDYLLNYEGIEIEKIILFGSCARGACKVTSDIDLCLITKDSIERYIRGDITSFLDEEVDCVKTDIVFFTLESFEESMSLIVKQIKTDGVVIYRK